MSYSRNLRRRATRSNPPPPKPSAELLEQLAQLKQLLIDTRDFRIVDDFFDQRVVPLLAGACTLDRNERLQKIIQAALQRALYRDRPVHLQDASIAHVAEAGFWFPMLLGWGSGCAGYALCFDDTDQGLIAFSESRDSPVVHYLRFTNFEQPPGTPYNPLAWRGSC